MQFAQIEKICENGLTFTSKCATILLLEAVAVALETESKKKTKNKIKRKGEKTVKKQPIKPCQNCIYFKVCGDHTRTQPCEGRKTKREQKSQGEQKCKQLTTA